MNEREWRVLQEAPSTQGDSHSQSGSRERTVVESFSSMETEQGPVPSSGTVRVPRLKGVGHVELNPLDCEGAGGLHLEVGSYLIDEPDSLTWIDARRVESRAEVAGKRPRLSKLYLMTRAKLRFCQSEGASGRYL